MQVREVQPQELGLALELAFQHLPAPERERRRKNLSLLLAGGACGNVGMFVLRDAADAIIGSILCEQLPGRTGLVWPPQVAPGLTSGKFEDALVQHGQLRQSREVAAPPRATTRE